MNILMSNRAKYDFDSVKFFPHTFCTVSTREGSILECVLDIYKHEIHDTTNNITLFSYKPVNCEIENNGFTEHISSIYHLKLEESEGNYAD